MQTTEEQTTDPEIMSRVRTRYASEIRDLHEMGFRDVGICVESLAPFSKLYLFPVLMMMRSKNEVLVSKDPLRLAAAYPLLANHEVGAYAEPMGMGVKFYSGFMDGMALVTSNFPSQDRNTYQLRKFGYPHSLPLTWNFHQKQIEELRLQGRDLQKYLSFEHYVLLSQLEITSLT